MGPAAVPQKVIDLARRLPPRLRLGTSSWSFPGWMGLVYDRKASTTDLARHGLSAYAAHPLLRAVGIDRAFYEPLTVAQLEEYAASVPDDFRFLMKAAGRCTSPSEREGRSFRDNPHFLDADFATREVVHPFVEGLRRKRGPLLFQFPPLGPVHTKAPGRFAERLFGFLQALPRGPWYAVEIRDRELLTPDYITALVEAGATHCLNVHSRMPDVSTQLDAAERALGGRVVVRWMLGAGLEYEDAKSRYSPFSRLVDEDEKTRQALASLCLERAMVGDEVLVIANNKAEGCAPMTLQRLAEAIVARMST